MCWKLPFLICLMITAANIAKACSCFGVYNWCQTTSGNSVQVIVKGVAVSVDTVGVYVKVLEQIKGTPNNDTIHIPHGIGSLCYSGLYINQIGDTLILALSEVDSIDIEFNPNFSVGDYTFYLCGTYVLDVKNDIVKGPIMMNISEMPYSAFINTDFNCTEEQLLFYKLRPNPASSFVRVNVDPLTLQEISIYNTFGQIIFHAPASPENDILNIDLKSYLPGLYFVQFKTKYSNIIKRLVIQ